ncbi:MAG: efflux RND transporter permease subunit [Paludibacteraceae bacterium]|nr:efflux RND transporter permease subunit [Paludibacteraceae bacterium]
MSIYKSAINKPITCALIFVAVFILGLFSLQKLPIDQLPEIEAPYVSVMTAYPGANASEVETNVTKILENNLNSVDGLKEITSTSKDNISLVMLEFEWGLDLDEAINDIRSYIDMVYDDLPDECTRPFIFKFSTSMMPIMQYAITAEESYPGLDKILNDQVINELNRIDGIGNLALSGAPERFVYVDIDPKKLDSYNLTLETVGQAVAGNNLNLASGSVKMGKEQYQLRVEGEYVESSEINDIVVKVDAGRAVFVRDIATVKDTIKDFTLEEKINGKDGVRLVVMKQTGANTVQVATDVKKGIEKVAKTLPPDIKLQMIYDQSEDIEDAIASLAESIGYALLFVVLVVLFFLGRWRATLIISLTIPISLVVAFIYLLVADSSINIISLCSLTVAIGMVVDDAIVVLENITRHVDRGSNPREAAIYATNEVWVSVIATTLVIVAVFMPLTMLGGQAGILFKELGWIVTITCCTSTIIAISLTPMLSSKLLKAQRVRVGEKGIEKVDEGQENWYVRRVIPLLDKVDRFYANALRVCLNHPKKTLLAIIVIFCLSLIPAVTGQIGSDFMAEQDNNRMSVTIELQRGTRVEETAAFARKIEKRMNEIAPEILLISSSTGSSDEANIASMMSASSNNKISMNVRCTKKDERERSIFVIAEEIRKEFDTHPEIINYEVSTSGGAASNSNVEIEIYGYNFEETNKVAEDIKNILKEMPGARDIVNSREEDRAELQIIFDKEKLALNGLTESAVSMYVRNRVNGMAAGYLKEDGEEYDIIVRLAEEHRNTISGIEELTLTTPYGKNIKLKELATIKEYWCPPEIERKRRERVATLSVTPVNISLGELAVQIQNKIDKMDVPPGVIINVGGAYEDQQETFADMGLLLALIVMLVFVVMASQFESLSKPFIIMMTVPFAFSGVILALWITGTNFDVIGALGAILLVGIVVKNGIVLVDYINLMRDRGHELNEAIALSGESRLRPVLMTAFTTLLGMLPMALSTGSGSEMWVPMGVVVIGGILVSTILTLILVPVLYSLMSRRGERDKAAETRKNFIFLDMPDTLDEDRMKQQNKE